MSWPRPIVTGAVVTILLLGGFAAGFFASPPGLFSSNSLTPPAKPGGYKVSKPNRGDAMITVPIPIHPLGSRSFALLDGKAAANVAEGQPVLLYTTSGEMLDTLGRVSSARRRGDTQGGTPTAGNGDPLAGHAVVHLDLGGEPGQNLAAVVRGEIVTGHDIDALRLPRTAFVKTGLQDAVWLAEPGPHGRTLARAQPVRIIRLEGDHAVFEGPLPSGEPLVILKPDTSLANGADIAVTPENFSVAAQTDDRRIAADMADRLMTRDAASRATVQAASDTPDTLAPATGAASQPGAPRDPGCPAPVQTVNNFIAAIRKLAVTVPAGDAAP